MYKVAYFVVFLALLCYLLFYFLAKTALTGNGLGIRIPVVFVHTRKGIVSSCTWLIGEKAEIGTGIFSINGDDGSTSGFHSTLDDVDAFASSKLCKVNKSKFNFDKSHNQSFLPEISVFGTRSPPFILIGTTNSLCTLLQSQVFIRKLIANE